jgi:metal-sulfur cluster biosynthetic enzyme
MEGRSVVTEAVVRQALSDVQDPILAQSVLDLGMVHLVAVARSGRVTVDLMLPSRQWPGRPEVVRAAQHAVAALPGAAAVDVRVIEDPAWTPYRLSQSLRAPLGLPDTEPPSPTAPNPMTNSRVKRLMRRLLSQ